MRLIFILIIFLADNSFASGGSNSYFMKTMRYSFLNLTQEVLIKYSDIDDNASSKIYNFKNSKSDTRIRAIIDLIDKINNGFQEGYPELGIVLTNDSNWRLYINKIDDNWQAYKKLLITMNDKLDIALLDKFIELDKILFDVSNESSLIYASKSLIEIDKLITILKILARNFYLISLNKNSEEIKEISKQMLNDFETIFFAINTNNDIMKHNIKEINELWERLKIIYEISIYADLIPKKKLSEQINMNYKLADKIFALKIYGDD